MIFLIATDVSPAALFLSRLPEASLSRWSTGTPRFDKRIHALFSNSVEMTLFRHVLNTDKIQDGTLKLPKMAKLF